MSSQLAFHQTSGDNWEKPVSAMLHESFQSRLTSRSTSQVPIFENLERQMAEQEADFETSLECLRKNFIFHQPQTVRPFLNSHRFLMPVLLESIPHLLECFGPNAFLALEVVLDEGLPTEIYALVLWHGDRSIARAALKKFDESWWRSNLRKSGGRIVFDYELL